MLCNTRRTESVHIHKAKELPPWVTAHLDHYSCFDKRKDWAPTESDNPSPRTYPRSSSFVKAHSQDLDYVFRASLCLTYHGLSQNIVLGATSLRSEVTSESGSAARTASSRIFLFWSLAFSLPGDAARWNFNVQTCLIWSWCVSTARW